MSDADGTTEDGLEAAIADAEESMDRLEERFGDVDDGLDDLADGIDDLADEFDADEIEEILTDLENVVEVIDEVEDILDAVDLSDLPEAIDAGALLEAIELGEVPAALGDEDVDLGDAVSLRALIKAIDLSELWAATNVRDLWQQKRELAEEADELTDESDEDGIVSEAADAVTDDEEDEGMVSEAADMVTGDDEDGWFDDDDEGWFDGDDWVESDFGDADVGAKSGMGFGGDDSYGLADGDAQEYQVLIQQKAFDGIGKFREALLKTHAKFDKLYEANREKMRRQDTSTNSRNPTAASTLVTTRRDMGGTAGKHSTVPQQVKYSTAPSRKRIYGQRFEQEIEKRREEIRDKRERHREGGESE